VDAFAMEAEPTPEFPAEPDPEEVTLELLEWNRLSTMVAAQANTRRARELLELGLPLKHSREESEVLQREMEEAYTLEQNRAKTIDLRGFIDVAPLITHASKGGLLDGESLVGIADSLQTAATLVRTLRDNGRDDAGDDGGDEADGAAAASGLTLLPSYFEGLPVQAELRLAIVQALDESGSVRDSADPALGDLRFARREVATAARRELGRLIQVKEGALASKSASIRDDRYVLQVRTNEKHAVERVSMLSDRVFPPCLCGRCSRSKSTWCPARCATCRRRARRCTSSRGRLSR